MREITALRIELANVMFHLRVEERGVSVSLQPRNGPYIGGYDYAQLR
jgi:hypothetical protein